VRESAEISHPTNFHSPNGELGGTADVPSLRAHNSRGSHFGTQVERAGEEDELFREHLSDGRVKFDVVKLIWSNKQRRTNEIQFTNNNHLILACFALLWYFRSTLFEVPGRVKGDV